MERPRPRPRAKHRSKSHKKRVNPKRGKKIMKKSTKPAKRESLPPTSPTSPNAQSQRPRPSLKLMKHRSHRISSSHPTKRLAKDHYKSPQLHQSTSPESKEEPIIFPIIASDTLSLSENTENTENTKQSNDILLHKLSKIKAHQKTRKSDFGRDFDEIKQFIHTQNNSNLLSNNSHSEISENTSLKLIGIRDPSSLLYHRQFDQTYEDKIHHIRTQSNVVSVSVQNNTANPIQKQYKHQTALNSNVLTVDVNAKYNHLRSYSSIMAHTQTNKNGSHNRNDSALYVKNVSKTMSPTSIFGTSVSGVKGGNVYGKRTKSKKEILQELADEYESESDEEDQDSDIKSDQ